MKQAEHEIRSNVGKLLKQKNIDVFIGYEKGSLPLRTSPCFVSSEKEAKKLIEQGFKFETGEYNDGGKLFFKYK